MLMDLGRTSAEQRNSAIFANGSYNEAKIHSRRSIPPEVPLKTPVVPPKMHTIQRHHRREISDPSIREPESFGSGNGSVLPNGSTPSTPFSNTLYSDFGSQGPPYMAIEPKVHTKAFGSTPSSSPFAVGDGSPKVPPKNYRDQPFNVNGQSYIENIDRNIVNVDFDQNLTREKGQIPDAIDMQLIQGIFI
jgi:hypothetical protein